MNANPRTFQYESIIFSIDRNETVISLYILKNKQVDAEQTYSLEQLKELSLYFLLFTSLKTVYDDLVSMGEKSTIAIKDCNISYSMILYINFKHITTVELVIPKQINIPLSVLDQFSMKAINVRLDKLEQQYDSLDHKLDLVLQAINNLDTQLSKLKNAESIGFLTKKETKMLSN